MVSQMLESLLETLLEIFFLVNENEKVSIVARSKKNDKFLANAIHINVVSISVFVSLN